MNKDLYVPQKISNRKLRCPHIEKYFIQKGTFFPDLLYKPIDNEVKVFTFSFKLITPFFITKKITPNILVFY